MPLFTVDEARAFVYQGEAQLADAAAYPDELIEDAAARIGEDFARICDVAFEPTTVTETLAGGGYPELALAHGKVTSIATVERWDGSAWSAFTGTYRLLDGGILLDSGGCWPRGRANIRVTYTHGYAEVPGPIKRAALILAVNDLKSSNVSDRATQQVNQFGSYNLSVAGWREHSYYGLPIVDSVLARYSERGPMVG